MSKKSKEIHGNNAKANPEHKIEPLFIANTVAMSDKSKHESPLVDDENVEIARNFVNENKK